MAKRILIAGGTGMLGQAISQRLANSGDSLTLLTRHPDKYPSAGAHGPALVGGDLTDAESLVRACAGRDVVIAAAHSLIGRGRYASAHVDGTGNRALIDAARQQGVDHFILISVIGAAPDHPIDFWRHKWAAEQHLIASGLSYTIVRSAAFMELHAHRFIGQPILEKGKGMILGQGDRKLPYVSVRDVAELIAQCLQDPALRGAQLEIAGPDALSPNEVAALYADQAGRPVRIRHIPAPAIRFMRTLIRPFHEGISRVMQVSLYNDRQDQRSDNTSLLQRVPMQLTSMQTFVRNRPTGGESSTNIPGRTRR